MSWKLDMLPSTRQPTRMMNLAVLISDQWSSTAMSFIPPCRGSENALVKKTECFENVVSTLDAIRPSMYWGSTTVPSQGELGISLRILVL